MHHIELVNMKCINHKVKVRKKHSVIITYCSLFIFKMHCHHLNIWSGCGEVVMRYNYILKKFDIKPQIVNIVLCKILLNCNCIPVPLEIDYAEELHLFSLQIQTFKQQYNTT